MLRMAVVVLLVIAFQPSPAQEKPSLVLVNPVFNVDPASNSASLPLLLRNESHIPVTLSLWVSDFKNKNTGQLLGGKSVITAPKDVPAGSAVSVKMDFSNLWEAGESEAQVFNNGALIGTLTAQRFTFPFSISLDGGSDAAIQLAKGSPGTLKIKNDDQLTYPLDWELSVPGRTPQQGSLKLGPKSTASVSINALDKWLDLGLRGFLRDSMQVGTFKVRYSDPANPRFPPFREFPLKVKFKSHSDDLQQLLTYLLIFIMLIAGGISSLFLNFAVPNNLKRITIKEQLATLASRISAISTKIDSRLRVALRLERQRLKAMLGSRKIYSPDLTDVFTRLTIDITLLTRRVELSEQLDGLRRQFNATHGLPTSCIDEVDKSLQEAADILRKNYVTQSDLDSAKASLDKAASLFGLQAQPPQFVEELAKRIKTITDALDPKTPLGKLHMGLPGPLPNIFIANNAVYAVAASIPAGLYTDLDNSACRLEIWIQYLRELQTMARPAAFTKAEERLLEYLDTNSWDAFYMARIVLREMQEKIYPEAISDALSKKQARISMDRQVARVFQPLEFCICFNNPQYDHSAASQEFSARWDFGDGLTETCWTIWHYYQSEEKVAITTTSFQQIGGPEIQDSNGAPLSLKLEFNIKPEEKNWFGERTRAELVRLGIALFIAVVGLIAGANQQLAKLDILPGLLAIFLVGFSADTIKNILSPPPAKS